MKTKLAIALVASLSFSSFAHATVVDDLLSEYKSQGASDFSAARGKDRWFETHPDPENAGSTRSCYTCHTKDLKSPGKHAKTGKVIDPMAPSVNKERLTDAKFIEKWFKRNCKWVLDRECTPQEKADYLMFLKDQ